jgi:hypothetical protein
MQELISLARALQDDHISIEYFRSHALEIIPSLNGDELLSVARLFSEVDDLTDAEFDVIEITNLEPRGDIAF